MHISDDEQLRRFKQREKNPLKRWKLTDEDWRNREKRESYVEAIEEMLERTDHDAGHWDVVAAEDKKHARVYVVETVCERVEAALKARGLRPPG
jgi:polyphosphate kinase 2 (PPK2 family)